MYTVTLNRFLRDVSVHATITTARTFSYLCSICIEIKWMKKSVKQYAHTLTPRASAYIHIFCFFSVSHRSEYFSVVWTRTMDMFSVFNDFNWRTIRKGRNVPADNELAKSKRKKMCHLKSVKMNSKFSFVLNLIGDKCGKWQTWCRTNGATNDCCWEPKW